MIEFILKSGKLEAIENDDIVGTLTFKDDEKLMLQSIEAKNIDVADGLIRTLLFRVKKRGIAAAFYSEEIERFIPHRLIKDKLTREIDIENLFKGCCN